MSRGQRGLRRHVFLASCVVAPAVTFASDVEVWVEDAHADFADGTLDASGQNLYVSRDGTIRTIHRFDLDQDGWLDLLFNNTHDWEFFVPATEGIVAPHTERMLRTRELPVEGSLRVVLEDADVFALRFVEAAGGQ